MRRTFSPVARVLSPIMKTLTALSLFLFAVDAMAAGIEPAVPGYTPAENPLASVRRRAHVIGNAANEMRRVPRVHE